MPGLGYEKKKRKLWNLLKECKGHNIIVAFSGGTDSSLLLKMVCEVCGGEHLSAPSPAIDDSDTDGPEPEAAGKIYAVTMQTCLHPVSEMETARRTAREIGAEHIVIQINELMEAGIMDNPPDRCYRCKRYLFSKMKEKAGELGAKILLEGTNEDDMHVYRPGIRALGELGIRSPLAEAGFTKAEVRRLAAEYGLSVAEKPASPCLATRFPYGTRLDYREMEKVAEGEEFLKECGLYNVRLRIHGTIARIEVDEKDFPLLLKYRGEVIRRLKKLGYSYVSMDLEGFRSGSMDGGILDAPATENKTDIM
ncbi:MAG: ATP-dependent sacrificial sulfur transferase LarE [Coprococcus sp.]|nr:ATP-dependent sacrificial sulfur transferase LarE [Coprococcus sp.]